MTTLSNFLTAQEQFNAAIDASVEGLSGDISKLNEMIADLQNSPDRVTAADQVRIDALAEAGAALASKIAAVDELTPPAAPEVPAEDPPVPVEDVTNADGVALDNA